jgi:hypothetical protein
MDTLDLVNIEGSSNDNIITTRGCPLEYKRIVHSPDEKRLFKYQAHEGTLDVKLLPGHQVAIF